MTDEDFIAIEKTIAADITLGSCRFQHCIQQAQQTPHPPSSTLFARAAGYWLDVMVVSLDRLELHVARRGLNLYQLVQPTVRWHYAHGVNLYLQSQLFGGTITYEEPRRSGVTQRSTNQGQSPPS